VAKPEPASDQEAPAAGRRRRGSFIVQVPEKGPQNKEVPEAAFDSDAGSFMSTGDEDSDRVSEPPPSPPPVSEARTKASRKTKVIEVDSDEDAVVSLPGTAAGGSARGPSPAASAASGHRTGEALHIVPAIADVPSYPACGPGCRPLLLYGHSHSSARPTLQRPRFEGVVGRRRSRRRDRLLHENHGHEGQAVGAGGKRYHQSAPSLRRVQPCIGEDEDGGEGPGRAKVSRVAVVNPG
jgi:hypothetical protein